MVERTFDVVVSGGGPGGSATAAFLARQGLSVALLDKANFPRDKACGDAISGKSVRVLQQLGIVDWVESEPHVVANGVRFSSPAGDEVVIPFPSDPGVHPGYVSRRMVFDNVVFQAARKAGATVFEGCEVTEVLLEDGHAVGVRTKDGDVFRAKVVVGADGALSPVARGVGAYDRDPRHWVASIRVYYEGVAGLDDNIEIHFSDPILPGYFWIFPLDNGMANVGVGMLESEIKANGRDMKRDLEHFIREHPRFAPRFKDARVVEKSQRGWILPLGSKHRPIHGDGWVLVGDAASLIDPFSGEGIGNAMVSGRLAAATITKALAARDTGAAALAPYEAAVRAELDRELMMSYKLQKLGRHTWLLNFVLRRAAKKPQVRDIISQMLADREKKEEFGSVWFYIKLLLM